MVRVEHGKRVAYVAARKRGVFAFAIDTTDARAANLADVIGADPLQPTDPLWTRASPGLGRTHAVQPLCAAGPGMLATGHERGVAVFDTTTQQIIDIPALGPEGSDRLRGTRGIVARDRGLFLCTGIIGAQGHGLAGIDPRSSSPRATLTTTALVRTALRCAAGSDADPWLVAAGAACLLPGGPGSLAAVDPSVYLWDLRRPAEPIAVVLGHGARERTFGGVDALAFDRGALLTGGVDGTVRALGFPGLGSDIFQDWDAAMQLAPGTGAADEGMCGIM
jgi:hypothetical protein